MSGEDPNADKVVLDELTPKQCAKEFKSVQKALHSKDFAVKLSALAKLSGDARYITEGSCLPSFFESLAPTKKLLDYLVPALTWFSQTLQSQAHLSISEHPMIKTLLDIIQSHQIILQQQSQSVPMSEEEEKSPKEPISPFALQFIQCLLSCVHFREELKKPKIKVNKKKDANLPPPPMPTENPVYGQIRFLASKCLYYLFLPVYTTNDTATNWFEKQGQEQRQRVFNCISDKVETATDSSSLAFKAQELLVRHIPDLLVSVHDAAFQHYQEYITTRSSTEPTSDGNPVFNNTNNVPSSVQSYQNAYFCWKVLALVIRHIDHRAEATVSFNEHSNLGGSEEEKDCVEPEVTTVREQETNILWSKIVSRTDNHKLLCDMVQDKHLGLSVMAYIMALTESLMLEERAWHIFAEENASISLLSTLVKLFHETGRRVRDYESTYQQFLIQHQQDVAAAAAAAADPKAAAKAAPPKKEDPKKGKAGAKEEVKPVVEERDTPATMTYDTIDMIHYPAFHPQALHQQQASSPSSASHGASVTEAAAPVAPATPATPATPLSVTSMARRDSLALYYLVRIFLRLARRGDTQSLLFEVREDAAHDDTVHAGASERDKKMHEELQKDDNQALYGIATIVQTIQNYLLSDVVSLMMFFPARVRHLEPPSETKQLIKWFEEEDNLQDIHVVSLLLIQSLSVLRYPDNGEDETLRLQKVRSFLVQHTEVHITVQKYLLASRKFYGVHSMQYDLLQVHPMETKHLNENAPHLHRGEEIVSEHHTPGHASLQVNTEEDKGVSSDTSSPKNEEYSTRLKQLFVARKKAERVIFDLLSYSSAPYFSVYPPSSDHSNTAGASNNVENHEERYLKPLTGLLSGPEKAADASNNNGNNSITNVRRLRRLSSHAAYVSPATLFHLNQASTTATEHRYNYLYFHDDWTQVGPFHAIHDFENVVFAATVSSEETAAANNAPAAAAAAKDTAGKDKKAKASDKKDAAAAAANTAPDMPSLTQLPSVAVVRYWLEMAFQAVQEHHQLSAAASMSNKGHVDFDLANRALRMLHLLVVTLPKRTCDTIVFTQELATYFVPTLGHYLDILLSYYLAQSEQQQQQHASNTGKKKAAAKPFHVLLEDGDPSIEEGIYDLFAILEVLLPTSVESIKQFALSNTKYHRERFQKIHHLLYVSGPVLLMSSLNHHHQHNNAASQQGLTDRILNKTQQFQRWKRMQERFVTVRDPRESALQSCVGFISADTADLQQKTSQQRSTPRHHVFAQKKDTNKAHFNFDVHRRCSLVADYAAYGLQHSHYVQHFVRDGGSVTEHRGRNVHATHMYHIRGVIWDVLGLLVSSDRKFRTVNTALLSAVTSSSNVDKNVANSAGESTASVSCVVPPILSQETIANNNLNPLNPVQSIISQSVVSECETVATEIVLQFVDLALQMSVVSSSLCSYNSNAFHFQSFLSADWFVSPEDGVQVRSLASSVAVKNPPLSTATPKHHKAETASATHANANENAEKDDDSARNDVVAASLRFLQEMGGMTTQGVTAALEGVVQTLKLNPYVSYTTHDTVDGENQETLTLLGHLISSLSRHSVDAVSLSASLSEYFSLPWSETARVRFFDEVFPLHLTAEKLFQPTFLLSQPRLWPWLCLVFPLLACVANPEAPVSLTEQCILTTQQCTQHHLSLFFPAQVQTYAPAVSDIVAAMFTYLGGAHLLSGHLGTFGLLSDQTKAVLTSTKTVLGEQSFFIYLLSRGICREQYWTNYHQQVRAQKQLEEEANKANIDPKTGKPIAKKDDKKPPAKKDDKKKDNKDNGNSNVVKENLVADILFNHDEFPADFYSSNDNKNNDNDNNSDNNKLHMDPNHGPDSRIWSLLLNRRAHVPQLLTASSPLLHSLILGQVGNLGVPASGENNNINNINNNNSEQQHTQLLTSLASSSSVAVHFISQLGGFISVNDTDNRDNGCTPLMYALLLQDNPCVEALLTFEGTKKEVCDVNARDAQGNPTMFYAFFGLQYRTQCTQLPSLHHPYYSSALYAFKQQQQEKRPEKQRRDTARHQPKQHFYFLYQHHHDHHDHHHNNAAEKAHETDANEDETDLFHALKPIHYRSHALFKPQLHLYDTLYTLQDTKHSPILTAKCHNDWTLYHLLGHCSLQTLQSFFCHPSVTTTLYATQEPHIRHHLHVFARSLRSKAVSFSSESDLFSECDGQTLLLTLLGATTVRLNLAGYTVQVQHEAFHLHDDRFALLTPHNGLRTYHKRHHAGNSRRHSKRNVHQREDILSEDVSEHSVLNNNNINNINNNNNNNFNINNNAVKQLSAEEEQAARTHVLQLVQELTRHLRVKLHPEEDETQDKTQAGDTARHRTQHLHAIDANQCDAQGVSPLCVAVCRGDVSLTKYLVTQLCVEVNMIDKRGFHVLHHLVATAPHAFYHYATHDTDRDTVKDTDRDTEHLMLYYRPRHIETQTMNEWQKDVCVLTLELFDLLVCHAENRPLVPFAYDTVDMAHCDTHNSETALSSLEKELEQLLQSAFAPLCPSEALPAESNVNPIVTSPSPVSCVSRVSRPQPFQVGKRLSKSDVLTLTRQRLDEDTHMFHATHEYNLLMLCLAGPALMTPLYTSLKEEVVSYDGSVSYEDHCPVSPVILCHTLTQDWRKTHYLYDDTLPSRYECRLFNGDTSALGHAAHRHTSMQREKHLRLLCFLHLWHRLETLLPVSPTYAGENVTLKRATQDNPFLKQLLLQQIETHRDTQVQVDNAENKCGVHSAKEAVNIVHCLAVACVSQSIAVSLTETQSRCKRLEYFVHPEAAVTQRLMRVLKQWSVADVSHVSHDTSDNDRDTSDDKRDTSDLEDTTLWTFFVRSAAPVRLLHATWDRRLTHYHRSRFPCVSGPGHSWSPVSLSIVQNNLDLVDAFYATLTENVSQDTTRRWLATLQPVSLMCLVPSLLTSGDLLHPELTSLFVDLASHRNQKDVSRELLMADIVCLCRDTADHSKDRQQLCLKAWHLAVEHGQVSLLASLLDCPKIDVNSPIFVCDTGGRDTHKVAVDTLVSQLMKRSKSIEQLAQKMTAKKTTVSSSSPRSSHNGVAGECHEDQRFRLWRMLESVKDRLDFTVRYAPAFLSNHNFNHTVNVVEEVLFLCDTVSWETPLHWLMQLVAMRKNDVLNALLAPLPSHLAAKYLPNTATAANKAIYEVILSGDRKMIRTYVQDLLHDVLQLQEEECTAVTHDDTDAPRDTVEEAAAEKSPRVFVEDAGDEEE